MRDVRVRSPIRSRPSSRAPGPVGSEIVVHPLQVSTLHHVLPPGGMTSEPPLPDCRTSLVTRRSVTVRGVQGSTSTAWSILVEQCARPIACGEVVALGGVLEQRHLCDVRVRPGGGGEAGQGEEDGTCATWTRANEALQIRAADGLAVVLHLGHSAVRKYVDTAVGTSSRWPGVSEPEVLTHELCGRGFRFPPCPDHRVRLLGGHTAPSPGRAWAHTVACERPAGSGFADLARPVVVPVPSLPARGMPASVGLRRGTARLAGAPGALGVHEVGLDARVGGVSHRRSRQGRAGTRPARLRGPEHTPERARAPTHRPSPQQRA